MNYRPLYIGLSTLILLLWGCADLVRVPPGRLTGADLLFSPDGKEYLAPAAELRRRLTQAEDGARRQMVEDLLDIVDTPSGYARLVAAEVLFDHPEWWSLSDRGAEVIARNLFCIAYGMPNALTGDEDHACFRLPEVRLGAQGHMRSAFELVRPYCEVWVGQHGVELSSRLPGGWCGEEAVVELDAKVILRKGPYRHDEMIRETVLWGDHLEDARLIGRHTLVSRLVLLSPDANTITLTHRWVVDVAPY